MPLVKLKNVLFYYLIGNSRKALLSLLMFFTIGAFGQVIPQNNTAPHTYVVTTTVQLAATNASIRSNILNISLAGVAVSAPNITYITPQTYTINTAIAPLMPANTGGAVPATIYGQTSTFAGSGSTGAINGTGTAASFSAPTRLAEDGAGNIFVVDRDNNLIREISPAGVVTTFAGGFNGPNGVTVDNAGNVFVADAINNVIKKITPGGVVSIFAGSGNPGAANANGALAEFYHPFSVIADAAGNLYVADSGNNLIRKITPAGAVSTLAGSGNVSFADGTGTAASFNNPSNIAIDAFGNILVADAGNFRIRKITPGGLVTTIAGTSNIGAVNGTATSSTFNTPAGVTTDIAGNIYIADINNNLIRKIDAANKVTTLAGSGSQGSVNAVGTAASFNRPNDVQYDGAGFLYVTDYGNNIIRKVIVTGYTINKSLPAGLTFDPTTGIISGTPSVTSLATDYTITAYNTGGSSTTIVNIAVTSTPLPPAVITFTPPANVQIDANNILTPGATSNNNAVPIIYGSSNTAVAYIGADGLVHVVGPGTTLITASQAAGGNYGAAMSVSISFTVKETQIIAFPAISAKETCQADFSPGAVSSNSTIPITYTSSNTAVATITAAGLIHILTVGTTVISANQAGDNLYIAANQKQQTLTVKAPVVPILSITVNNLSVCAGSALTYTATIANASSVVNPSYQWQLNGVNVGTNSPVYTNSAITTASVVKCTVTNNDACPTTASQTLSNISALPNVMLTASIAKSPVNAACSGMPVTFTATTNAAANATYQWHVNGLNAGSNSSVFSSSSFNNGDVVTCTVTNEVQPCLVNLSVTSNPVTVNIIIPGGPAPSVTITASANNVYAGVPITFTAVPVNAGAVNYQWQVNGINAGPNNAVFTTSTLNNGDIITCTISSVGGCLAPATSQPITAIIFPPLKIVPPNTFTPNGDGVNDTWVIAGLSAYPNCLVTIYTRYGSVIFQSKGYATEWDGIFKGSELTVGTYYYIIDLGNNRPLVSGYVTIIR